jgi:hypothetical protein
MTCFNLSYLLLAGIAGCLVLGIAAFPSDLGMLSLLIAFILFLALLVLLLARWAKRRRAGPAAAVAPAAAFADRGIRFVSCAVLGWALVDALVAGQGAISLVLCALAVLYFLPRALVAWRNRTTLTLRLWKTAIVAVGGLAALAFIRYDIAQGRIQADQVVAAVQQFREKQGRYPDRLAELVPGFLPAVPRARWAYSANEFRYVGSSLHPRLIFVGIPPFDRRIFNFETGGWDVID